ncbi:proline-rich protein 2-like [Gracilinanus agilis]|uniref:proline-rich protein 2-like n=1 Tax=Gracilinanus agilis TaxID=191870 RepID=UPI001CFEBB0E|nr:proline-rich protein 2-like [Gracilinanus agilis]
MSLFPGNPLPIRGSFPQPPASPPREGPLPSGHPYTRARPHLLSSPHPRPRPLSSPPPPLLSTAPGAPLLPPRQRRPPLQAPIPAGPSQHPPACRPAGSNQLGSGSSEELQGWLEAPAPPHLEAQMMATANAQQRPQIRLLRRKPTAASAGLL